MATIYLDPKIWGPHYWFFIHTTAMTYPQYPNAITKKKYYEFIQNLPLFIPVEEMSSAFVKLINRYPVTPYLDNRDSLVRWTHFIHNKINEKIEAPQISLNDFFIQYYNEYKTNPEIYAEYYKLRKRIIYASIITSIVGTTYYFYNK